jgi:DNA-binding response OmpR family regulator
VARLEAVTRRLNASRDDVQAVRAGELEVRPEMFDAYVGGQAVGLTRREFELLGAFVGAIGTVLSREDLYERVWGYAMAHGDRSVDVFVRRLRTKLAAHSPDWTYLHTHFGVGYRFHAELHEPTGGEAAGEGPTSS